MELRGAQASSVGAAEEALGSVRHYRNFHNGIQALAFDSLSVSNAFGVTQGDPGAAQNPAGDTIVVARDTANGLWLNVHQSVNQSWKGWISPELSSPGTPGVAAVPDGTIWIAMRDAANSIWLWSYRTDAGFGGAWIGLGGAFSLDPAIAVATDGSSYIVRGRPGAQPRADLLGPLRSGFGLCRLGSGNNHRSGKAGRGGGQRWSGLCGGPLRRRREWNSHLAGNTWGQWYTTSKAMSSDPQLAAANGLIYVVEVDSVSRVWANAFAQGAGNGWYGWTDTYGFANPVAIATLSGQFYIVGRDPNGDIWWYRSGVG